MKAVVYKQPRQVVVEDVENPTIEAPNDAIIRITTSGLCGSDLHMYDGRTSMETGRVFGHEPIGVVEEVGQAVVNVKPGDRVVVPFNVACGFCFNCQRGFTSACLTMNPMQAGAAYGYADMGPYKGAQAEYLRVPYADFNCLKLPGRPDDELEDDFLLLSDVFPTGWHATELAGVQPGDTVAIYGAGPVGLLAAHSALIKGASEVFVVDMEGTRLRKAEELGAIPINYTEGDPAMQIFDIRTEEPKPTLRTLWGEPKMGGVMRGIDAVGFQAHDFKDPHSDNPINVLDELIQLVNPTGGIGVIGVYEPQDPGGQTEAAKKGKFTLMFGQLWSKGLTLGTGQTPVAKYNAYLRDLIVTGRARPSAIVSHKMPLAEAPEAYARFDRREPGYTKVLLKVGAKAA